MKLIYPKNKKVALKELSAASDYLKHIKCSLPLPKKAVLCPIGALTKYVENHYQYKKYNCEGDIYVLQGQDACFVTNFGIGAPGMAMVLEVLIALGVKEFVLLGIAGSLQPEVLPADMVLCSAALCDDGVSPNYTTDELALPHKKLTEKIGKLLTKDGLNFHLGPTWTTDAIFRETKAEVAHYQKHNLLTVEMEASAFFAICARKKVKAAALFVISDLLANLKWEPHFGEKAIFRNLETTLLKSLEALK